LEQALPPFQRQTLLEFVKRTWAGKILAVNTIIFVWMCWLSGSLMMPEAELLVRFGAKVPSLIAQGEWWRLITPMFVHIGLIHFLFNSYAIFLIGGHLEPMLGARWFLLVYFLGGILGNVASAVFTLGISAGASSSLFAMLGCGFVLERVIGRHIAMQTGRKPQTGIYTIFIVLNLAIGFMIPMIDNAAHIGGLVGGILLTFAILFLRPNRLRATNRIIGGALIAFVLGLVLYGAMLASSAHYIAGRYQDAGDSEGSLHQAIAYYSQALVLLPEDASIAFSRGRALLLAGFPEDARRDFVRAAQDEQAREQMYELMHGLSHQGLTARAAVIEGVLDPK